jgi:hypothetical protein
MKFTEWSRILSAHAGGQLISRGANWITAPIGGDIVQVAKLVHGPNAALIMNVRLGRWFDLDYLPTWTPEELIAGIEANS